MVLLQLGHETTIGAHDRPLGLDRSEGLARRHFRGGHKVGDHDRRTPADAHEAVDLFFLGSRSVILRVLDADGAVIYAPERDCSGSRPARRG